MNKRLLALSLGLFTTLAGTSAFATTGTINFEGKILSSTCPIEVFNPEDGTVHNQVKMGTVEASRFTAVGQEIPGKRFGLRLTPAAGCGLNAADNTAKVTFNGIPDPSGDYFAISPGSDPAQGVAISIKDHLGRQVKPGAATADYDVDIDPAKPTEMIFHALYRSLAATVIAGPASADVQFIVAIN